VIGLIELGWTSARLGLTEDGFEMENWDILEIDPAADTLLFDKLDHIIARLNKKETMA
jgi:hypothetical protein